MTSSAKFFQDYINGLKTNLKLGNATEHTHRPVLKTLLESAGDKHHSNQRAEADCVRRSRFRRYQNDSESVDRRVR